MVLTGNPLRDIYDAVWAMLEDTDQSSFSTKVAEQNRIKHSSSAEDILSWEVEAVPLSPEAAVVITKLKPADRPNSSCQLLVVEWEVWVRLTDSANATFLDIQWEIYKALLNWEPKLRATLVLDANYYCRNVDTMSVDQSFLVGKKPNGWRAAWVGQCDCWFQHTALVN